MNDPIVIVSAARTAMGCFQGGFASLTAANLGAIAIRAAVERAGIDANLVDEVLMGCVLQAGQGQAPARQAALQAGLPLSAGCATIHKVCGSAMKATMLGHDGILAGSYGAAVVGGMESMTNAPYLLPKARGGYRLGHGQMFDHMFMDGLEDAYSKETRGRLMGTFAEECATTYGFTREAQDEYAVRSTTRAIEASNNGSFDWEIAPVTVAGRKGDVVIDKDEGPFAVNIDKIPTLKPAFAKDGTITAANASSISDGAAALVVTRQSVAEAQGLNIAARIVSWATHSQEPAKFTSAPVPAIRSAMEKAGWTVADVDLFEVNEAFAMVPMIAMKELGIPAEKLNVNGGGTALGHPIGASGARIIATLIAALQNRGLKRGVASLCIGGGEGTAIAVEIA